MKKNKQKPIEYDVHLKYLCKKCGQIHWLSLKESSTKNFKIVCDCGYIFGVKRTNRVKILYSKVNKTSVSPKSAPPKQSIPETLLSQGIRALISYGFTKKEASELLEKTYILHPSEDVVFLVKESLSSLRN